MKWGNIFFAGSLILPCSSLWACPLCYSGTGKQVRAGILNGDFLFNFTVTLLPFVVFTFIGLMLYGTTLKGVFLWLKKLTSSL